MFKRFAAAVLLLFMLTALVPPAFAAVEASNIADSTTFISNVHKDLDFLSDGNTTSYRTLKDNCTVTLLNDAGIGSVYLMFDVAYGEYIIENGASGETITGGQHGYLHEYIDLDEAFHGPVTSVSFYFNQGEARISEMEVYSVGQVPDHVQIWQPPLEDKTDILLLSTHGDDDQLFFAGLLPRYAGQEKVAVQVAYLTDHRNLTNQRTHEILNGLWATGCTAYPVMADFPDFRIDSLRSTYQEFARLGYLDTQLLEYVVGLLRRFKPQVVVGHDIDGEYGHGMHMVYTDCLIKALEISDEQNAYPVLAQTYGVWDVPKTYLHLYNQNTIELDYDQPLSAFGGMTAFEVSQKRGYPCHRSQQGTWFTDWINGDDNEITKATQIKRYNPCRFGLYRTTVGVDVAKDDFLENIVTYGEQERIEQAKQEQERLEQEAAKQELIEKERQELERIEAQRAEEKRREEERLAQEKLLQEQLRAEQQRRQQTVTTVIAICAGVIGIAILLIFITFRRIAARRFEG